MKSDICPHGRSLPFLASCCQRGPPLPLGRDEPQRAFVIFQPKCWLWADAAWYPSVGGTLSGLVTSVRAGPLPWGCLSWVRPGLSLLAVKDVPPSLALFLILMSHLTCKLGAAEATISCLLLTCPKSGSSLPIPSWSPPVLPTSVTTWPRVASERWKCN